MGDKGTMATIYKLAERIGQDSRGTSDPAQPVGHTAEIFLFTGVRYERWPDAPVVPETGPIDLPRAKCPAKGTLKG
jgi:hypothetical protein